MKTNRGIWRCIRDGCTHFWPRNLGDAPTGNKCYCTGCSKDFILTYDLMESDHPRCADCTESLDLIGQFLEERMPERDPIEEALRRARIKALGRAEDKKKDEPKDQIEVIEPDEEN